MIIPNNNPNLYLSLLISGDGGQTFREDRNPIVAFDVGEDGWSHDEPGNYEAVPIICGVEGTGWMKRFDGREIYENFIYDKDAGTYTSKGGVSYSGPEGPAAWMRCTVLREKVGHRTPAEDWEYEARNAQYGVEPPATIRTPPVLMPAPAPPTRSPFAAG